MAFYKEDIVDIDLNSGNIFRSFLNHSIGYKDDNADRFGIRAFRDGEPMDLSGASCQAVFMAPNGTNIALTSYGTVSGNKAYVTLPQACYDYEGQFCLAIKLVGGGVTGTVRIVDGTVTRTGASGAVAPTAAVPTYQEILAVYAEMQEDIADYESVVDNQNQQISDLKSAFNQVASNIPNLFTGTFDESGYINPQTGANADNANYKRTKDFYPVKIANGNKIYFKTSATTPNMQIVVYNSDKSAVQATTSRNNTTSEASITISSDGFFRLYTNASYAGDVYVGQMPFNEYGEYSNYKIPIDAVSNEIKEPLEMADLIYRQTGKNIFDVNSPNVVTGYYLDTSGNEVESSDWNISDYINVEDFSAIVGSIFTSSGAYFTYCKLNLLHTYTEQKTHIRKVWDESTNGVYSVESGVGFVRFCWKNNETADNRKIMIEEGTEHSQSYEPYTAVAI